MNKNKKILIVDDEPDMLEVLRARLEPNGFKVLTAGNAKEAYELAEELPDVIILDIMMTSAEEGYSIFAWLKFNELTKDIPIIFLTCKIEDRNKTLNIGASYFITKPYESSELLEKIHLALKGKQET